MTGNEFSIKAHDINGLYKLIQQVSPDLHNHLVSNRLPEIWETSRRHATPAVVKADLLADEGMGTHGNDEVYDSPLTGTLMAVEMHQGQRLLVGQLSSWFDYSAQHYPQPGSPWTGQDVVRGTLALDVDSVHFWY